MDNYPFIFIVAHPQSWFIQKVSVWLLLLPVHRHILRAWTPSKWVYQYLVMYTRFSVRFTCVSCGTNELVFINPVIPCPPQCGLYSFLAQNKVERHVFVVLSTLALAGSHRPVSFTRVVVVVILTITRVIKSVVTGQAAVTLELRNTPGKKHKQAKLKVNFQRWYTHISQLTQFMPPPETKKSEIGSQPTMCQVHTEGIVHTP